MDSPAVCTDLDNLLPLCSRHHHLVHEGGWTLTLRADRTTVWCRPDGTIHYDGSTVDVAPTGVAADEDETAAVPTTRRLELLNGLSQTPEEIAELAHLARARVRALGPPSRAPAA